MQSLINIFLILVLTSAYSLADDPLVNFPYGTIRGRQLSSPKGAPFYAFQEIPYARPPIGNLRFQEAQPPENWDGILDTTSNTKICYQYVETSADPRQSEDCLFLNVYTPIQPGSNPDSLLPILVYIHGGGFQFGDGTYDSIGPDFFMDMEVIIVSINYRLGPLGFLTTEDGVIPANLGLKDQILALKWIQENIELFGGDPDKVTISGQSAGGASVGYLILSQRAKGLFRAGILQSGSPICTWSYQRKSRQSVYDFVRLINSSFTDDTSSEEVLEYLQSLPVQTIIDTMLDYGGIRIGLPYAFALVTEDPDLENTLITEKMHEALQNFHFNNVPIMIGTVSEETIYLADDLDDFKNVISQFDDDLSLAVSEDFNVDPENLVAAGAALRSIYVSGLFQDDLGNAIRYRSDARYTTAVIEHAVLHSKVNNVYFYQFSYSGQLGNATNYTIPGISGNIPHKGELKYFWSWAGEDLEQYPESDRLTHERVMALWTNFVKTLNPTPEEDPLLGNVIWPKAIEDDFKYLDIDSELEVKVDPKEYKKWKQIIDTYGNPPYDTY